MYMYMYIYMHVALSYLALGGLLVLLELHDSCRVYDTPRSGQQTAVIVVVVR